MKTTLLWLNTEIDFHESMLHEITTYAAPENTAMAEEDAARRDAHTESLHHLRLLRDAWLKEHS